MNRIYQGRVSKIQISADDGTMRMVPLGDPANCLLWQHHCIFQDAVNYYLAALGSLADSTSGNRVIRDLRARLADSWVKFPRDKHGASSLRDSLRRSLPDLKADASLQDAFDAILFGNEASPHVRTLSLTLILAKCGGDAAIQQGGRAYLPRLCDAKSNPTWDFSPAALESGSGSTRLASVLHADSSQEELEAVARDMDLSWTVKVQPGKAYVGEEAKARLKEAIVHLIKLLITPSPRLAEALSTCTDDPEMILRDHLSSILKLPDDFSIPRNRKAAPDLTFASIAFKCFPGPVTQLFLKLGLKAPKPAAKASSKTSDDALLSSLGDDPIKLARGS